MSQIAPLNNPKHKFFYTPEDVPIYTKYLQKHGYIHFHNFFTQTMLEQIVERYEYRFEKIGREKPPYSHDIPIAYGIYTKEPQRIPFLNKQDGYFENLVLNHVVPKLRPIHFDKYRVGLEEKNGLVATKYNGGKGEWNQIGWHTDIHGSLSSLKEKESYYNVGIHFDESDNLKILPDTHIQSNFTLHTKKLLYLDTNADKNEMSISTKPGDLTIHDGRLWHRVARNHNIRRVMYFTLLKGQKVHSNRFFRLTIKVISALKTKIKI